MSLDLSLEDYWSATTRCTIRERCKFMFNNELLSDVKFQVVDQDAEGGSNNLVPRVSLLTAPWGERGETLVWSGHVLL